VNGWATAVGVLAAIALGGCPKSGGGTAPPPTTAPPASKPTSRPADPTPTPESVPAPKAEPDAPSESTDRFEWIKQSTVLSPQRGVSIGLVEVVREPHPLALLSVGHGPYAFSASLALGEHLHVAGGELEVVELAVGGDVRVRWVRLVPSDLAERPGAIEVTDPLTLPDMGLYALPKGRVLAVGNVRNITPLGEAPRLGVTLALFPKGYDRDPSMGYDQHLDAAAGTLTGKFGSLDVERVEPAAPAGRARVTLRIR
jgi:hypothetical protein